MMVLVLLHLLKLHGDGELCGNGIARKSVITYVCNMKGDVSYPKISGTVEDCTVSLTVETPFACPTANYCASISSDEKCNTQGGVCVWAFGKCRVNSGCLGFASGTAGLVAFLLVTVTGLLLLCTCGLCICACKKRRAARKARRVGAPFRRSCKKARKSSKKTAAPREDAEYVPFQMPFQLIPGGNAPVDPYSNIQGYPMVTLVAPGTEEQDV